MKKLRKKRAEMRILLGPEWKEREGLEAGIPLKVMQTILGHSSLAMTADLYSHVLPDTKADEMKKLQGVL